MTPQESRARLRELAEKATPGRWYRDDSNYRNLCAGDCVMLHGTEHVTWDNDADADYVEAANPATILTLLSALRT